MTTFRPACLKQMPDPRPGACPYCDEPLPPVESNCQAAEPRSPLPQHSAIEIWQAAPERRIFHLRGGKGGFPIAFGVLWIAIVAFITVGMVFGARVEGDRRVGAAVLSIFWVVGAGMLYAGVRHRFLKTTILLEKDRLLIERDLLGWKSAQTTALAGVAPADLVVAYEQNYKPVFAVRVSGVERKIQFGAPLDVADKNWLVDEINGFLAGRLLDGMSEGGDGELRAETDEELEAILAGAGVVITRPGAATIRLSSPACSMPTAARIVGATVCAGFAGLWYAALGAFFVNVARMPFPESLGVGLFLTPFLFAGLMPLCVAAALLWGEARVDVGPNDVVSRLGAGWLGFTRRLAMRDVDFVGAEGGEDNPRWRSRPATTSTTCVVRAGAKSISLCFAASPRTCRALAELVRRRIPHRQVGPTDAA